MSVHYKFKSTLDFDTVSFDGLHISVADLKKAIFHQKRIGKNTDFDLQITNAQTKEDYTDDNTLIAKNTSLIVARVPLTVQQKRAWDKAEAPAFNNSKDESNLGRSVDLTRLDGSEEDKIRAMMTQSTQDYDPSNYMKIRGSNQTGEVPPNYRCYKCHQPGHWIKNCPLGVSQEPIEIKKSTGIPRSFMVPVEGPSVPGAMMTPGGTYAVPAIDHQAYKEGKKERPPFAQDPEPVIEKPEIPEDLLCNICKDLLTDAVMIPCCGNSFCDECIRTFLLESEEHECPDCNEKDVSPDSLIPNRYLRNAVLNFKNETGYAKRPIYKPPPPQPTLSQKIAMNSGGGESSISEKLAVSPTLSAATPAQAVGAVTSSLAVRSSSEIEAKEADKPVGKASPTYEKATLNTESSLEMPDVHNDLVTKLTADDETEVPPPPGTEPPLLPKRSSDSWQDKDSNSDIRDDEGRDKDRYSRERRRSFSRDNHRERNTPYHNRIDNVRPSSRRRSLSPRNSHHSEYPMHQAPAHGKNYQGHMPSDGRYHPPSMHYDPNLRRSTEDRAGTPTVDEPHLHPPTHSQPALLPYPPGEDRVPPPTYSTGPAPPPATHNPPLLPDPYMAPPRMAMYPPHQQPPAGHGYGPPPPPQRYDGRPPYQQQPGGYRPTQPPRNYNTGPPRPMRGIHNMGYRGMQPPPPGMGRTLHNGTGVIDDPLEAFQRMLREKDERDRRMGKHRSRRTRSRSRSRSYSRSRSRSFGRRSSPSRPSRSRSPPPKRRVSSRSPPSSHRTRSRTPTKKRRSRSGSFSMSRSRSYSRSQSPRGSLPRERDRDRKVKRSRDAPAPYRTPPRSPPRYHKERDRERERPRSREPYGSYYGEAAAPVGTHDYQSAPGYREPLRPERPARYPSRGPALPPPAAVPASTVPPPPGLMGPVGQQIPASTQPPPAVQVAAPAAQPPSSAPGHHLPPLDRKDYYDSYNRYPGAAGQQAARFANRFDDVAPPGTEGYYDLPPPGVDHLERPKERAASKDKEAYDREDRERRGEREKDERERRDREDRHKREDDRRDYDKDRYKDERHRGDDKSRSRGDRDRRDRDYDYEKDSHRHDRYSLDRKRSKRSSSPYTKYRSDTKDSTPERPRKKDKDHEDKAEERKKEKKIKEKKKKKDSEEKEKKKKKKKEKKALIQKEAAAAAAAAAVVNATTLPIVKVKEEPQSGDEAPAKPTTPVILPGETVVVKVEPVDEPKPSKVEEKPVAEELPSNSEPPETKSNEKSPKPLEPTESNEADSAEAEAKPSETLYGGLADAEISTTTPTSKPEEEAVAEPSELKESIEIEDDEEKQEEGIASPKKDEFLAPVPELSKWERDESAEKLDDSLEISDRASPEPEDPKNTKVVTTEVLKRAENAIFQKAINAIRPIEIKKISESRKVLYQNPEPKILEADIDRDLRKNVNVTINVSKNERNVEISEPLKKSKADRSKFKGIMSPTRLSAKDRLGEKIEEEAKLASIKCVVDQRRETSKTGTGETTPRARSPRLATRERRVSLTLENTPIVPNPERKVFLENREKRDRSRMDIRQPERLSDRQDPPSRSHDRAELRKVERLTRTPPPVVPFKARKDDDEEKEERVKKDAPKRSREDKKRKKEHRSRSKSRDRKKRKDKKHKKDRERTRDASERRQKHSKEKENVSIKDKSGDEDKETAEPSSVETWKKQRRNPRLVPDRKRSLLDEASFEPDYSASDSESEEDDRSTLIATKRAKVDDSAISIESDTKSSKKRPKPSSSEDDDSSSTESSSSESDSSVESHRKKKKKHKKRKKRKAKRESTSESDAYSDSSDSSSEEEKHRKKKKSKSKSKQSKKKKKSKHK